MRIDVTPVTAVINKDTDLIGKMDPYVEVIVRNTKQRTQAIRSGGHNPTWNETFSFTVDPTDLITFRIYDRDRLSRDDFIGEVFVPMSDVLSSPGGLNRSYPIQSSKNGGFLTVGIRVSGGNYAQGGIYPMYAQAPPAYQAPMQTYAPMPITQALPMTQSVVIPQTSYVQPTYVQPPVQTTYVQQPVQTTYVQPAVQTTYVQQPVQTTRTTYVEQPVQTTYVEHVAQPLTQQVSYVAQAPPQPVYTTETSYAYTVTHPHGSQPAVLSGFPYSTQINSVPAPQQTYYR